MVKIDEDDVRIIMQNLPNRIHGFCYHDDDDNVFVVLNARDSHFRNLQTLDHELRHIRRDDLHNKKYKEYK